MEEKINLVDYISPNRLQELQDSFSNLVGMGAEISDENGSAITQATGMCEFCKYTRVSRIGSERCRKCDSLGAEQAFLSGNAVSYTCHAGLTDFVAPIVIDDKRVGCFVGGQIRTGELDEARVRQTAIDIGVNPDMYLMLAKKTPLVSEDTLKKAMKFIEDVTLSISDMAYKQYQIEQAKEAVDYAAKLKSDFLANMSHEIRTPMNGVIGMAELALREELTTKARKYVSQIHTSGKSLLAIINDILDFSKIESGKMDIITDNYIVREMVSDAISLVQKKANEKGIKLVVNIDDNVPPILVGDSMRIHQVLLNLINNAVKFTDKGSVTIDILCKPDSGNNIILTCNVTDTGIGIAKENKNKLFASFQQVDSKRNRSVEGTGLGLAISKQLIMLMDGEIGVESTLGEGSKFWFSLPQQISHVKIEDLTISEDEDTKFIAPDARILVVDDNEVNLTVAIGLIEPLKIQVDSALSGIEALKKIASNSYDIIFMDHMMPEVDGIETTITIRQEHEEYDDVPIIALTANAVEGSKEMYLSAGMNDYISKPVDNKVILRMIRKWLPEEKIIEIDDASVDELPETTLKIDGLDVEQAIRMLGSEKVYMTVLKHYYKAAKRKALSIKNLYETQDWHNYTIEVHALKSSSKQIGAIALGNLAAELEEAGNAIDLAKLHSDTDRLLQMYEQTRLTLEQLFDSKDEVNDKAKLDAESLKQYLAMMNNAFDELDETEMSRIMDELNLYSYDADIDDLLNKLGEAIENIDVDAGAEYVSQILLLCD